MIKFRIFSLFFLANVAQAANYIDNPNFDLGFDGWYFSGDSVVTQYEEEMARQIIYDQYVDTHGVYSRPFPAPKDVPLYFSVEVGFSGHDSEMKIGIVIYEIKRKSRPKEIPGKPGFQLDTSRRIMSKKIVTIRGNDRWHV